MTYGEKRVFLPQIYFVDTSFLRMFDFPLLKGDRHTALQKPNSIVLTESAARELFGNADPIGKTVSHFGEDTLLFTVTGILKDVPGNSQFQFDALQSFNTIYKPDWMNRWGANWRKHLRGTRAQYGYGSTGKEIPRLPEKTSESGAKSTVRAVPPAVKGCPCECRRYQRGRYQFPEIR